jgi:hypothetical protein
MGEFRVENGPLGEALLVVEGEIVVALNYKPKRLPYSCEATFIALAFLACYPLFFAVLLNFNLFLLISILPFLRRLLALSFLALFPTITTSRSSAYSLYDGAGLQVQLDGCGLSLPGDYALVRGGG